MRLGGAAVKDLTGIQMVEGHFVNGQIFVDILRSKVSFDIRQHYVMKVTHKQNKEYIELLFRKIVGIPAEANDLAKYQLNIFRILFYWKSAVYRTRPLTERCQQQPVTRT